MQFPVYLPIGPYTLHPHVLFELLAYGLGFQLFLWLRRRDGDTVEGRHRPVLILAAVAGAIAGSKILAWLIDPQALWAGHAQLSTWLEGKTIVGGLLGGWLAVEWAKKRMNVTRRTGDLYAVPLATGIAVGRIGCFLTGLADRTYGTYTTLPWGVDFGDGRRHPTQLYEMIFLGGLLMLLALQRQRGHARGDQFRLMLGAYLAWRLAIGFLQPAPSWLGLAVIQWACVIGLLGLARDIPRILSNLRRGAFVPPRDVRDGPHTIEVP